MELEELKGKNVEIDVAYSKKELEDIFKVKTLSTVKRINRTMLIDAIVMTVLTALLVGITFYLGLKSKYLVSSQIIGAAIILFVHYKIKFQLINASNPELGVVQNVKKTLKYLKRYSLGYYITVPLLTLGMSINLYLTLSLEWSFFLLITFLLGIVTLTLACTHVIVRAIYSKPISRIKKIIQQFNDLTT